jgi:predicted peptidase
MNGSVQNRQNSFYAITAKTMMLSAFAFMVFSIHSLAFTVNSNHPAAGQLTAGKQVVQVYTSGNNTWVYLCYLPFSYESQPSRKWPMILHQPCLDGTADLGFGNLLGSNCSSLSGYLQTPELYHFLSDSFIVVTPWQFEKDFKPCLSAAQVDPNYQAYYPPLFAHLFSTIRIDTLRISMMGACWGAGLIYKLVSLYPGLPSGLVLWALNEQTFSCCDISKACAFKNVPMTVIHGFDDAPCPWQNAKAVVDAITGCGNSNCTWYLEGGIRHECWINGPHNDKDTALYSWLLKQKNSTIPTVVRNQPYHSDVGAGDISLSSSISIDMKSGIVAIKAVNLHGQVLLKGKGAALQWMQYHVSQGKRTTQFVH